MRMRKIDEAKEAITLEVAINACGIKITPYHGDFKSSWLFPHFKVHHHKWH